MPVKSLYSALKMVTPLHRGVRAIKQRITGRKANFWVINGQERESGQALKLFFSGQLENRNYITHLAFGDIHSMSGKSSMQSKKIFRHAVSRRNHCDLAVIQTETLPSADQTANDWFAVPCWVGGEKNLQDAVELARRSDHIKSDIRRIRKNKLDYRVTRDPEEFDRFYHTMYLPYIQNNYGDRAMLMSYESMKAAQNQCELFLVTQGDNDIAGGILVYDDTDRVRGWSLGVKDGDFAWVKAGALAAFEYLQTGYLFEKGYKRLHRGASRPFLYDGALSFKKNRGMKLTDHKPHWFVIIPLKYTAAVRSFLINNPFIYQDESRLKGAVFLDKRINAESGMAKLFRDTYVTGLDQLNLYCINDGNSEESGIHHCGALDSSGKLHVL